MRAAAPKDCRRCKGKQAHPSDDPRAFVVIRAIFAGRFGVANLTMLETAAALATISALSLQQNLGNDDVDDVSNPHRVIEARAQSLKLSRTQQRQLESQTLFILFRRIVARQDSAAALFRSLDDNGNAGTKTRSRRHFGSLTPARVE